MSQNKVKKTLAASLAVLSLAAFGGGSIAGLDLPSFGNESIAVSAASVCKINFSATVPTTGEAVSGVEFIVKNKSTGAVAAKGVTNSAGKLELSVSTGATYVINYSCCGISKSSELYVASGYSSMNYTVTFTEAPHADCYLTVTVKDINTGSKAANAVVTVKNKSTGKFVAQGLTGSDGTVKLSVPRNATYILTVGYGNAEEKFETTVGNYSSMSQTVSLSSSAVSSKYTETVYAKDFSGNALSGAVVSIINKSTGKTVGTKTTGSTGAVTFDLAQNTAYTIKVTYNGSTVTQEISTGNYVSGKCTATFSAAISKPAKAGIKLKCTDDGGYPVQGAVIAICKDVNNNGKYDKGDVIVVKGKTPANGILSTSKSFLNTEQQYLITALSAPVGYTRKTTVYSFTLPKSAANTVVNVHKYLPKNALVVKRNVPYAAEYHGM